jgi:hypothetical protein
MADIGKILLIAGAALIVIGALFILGGKLGLGNLPGDIIIKKKNFTFMFPIATSILLSIILTLIVYLARYFKK